MVHTAVIFMNSGGNKTKTCEPTPRDFVDIMGLRNDHIWKQLQKSCVPQSAEPGERWALSRPLPPPDWQREEPIGSRLAPRGAPFKMPPPAARAPADGGFLLPARDAESRSAREEQVEREQDAGRADVDARESWHSAINKQTNKQNNKHNKQLETLKRQDVKQLGLSGLSVKHF